MSIARNALLWASHNQWLERQMRRRAFARRAVRRFMPGERVEDALDAATDAATHGIGAILTQLGENVTSPDEAAAVHAHYRDVLRQIADRRVDAEVSVKLTQLGLDIDRGACTDAVTDLARRAAEMDDRLWIDMEDSSYTDVTIEIFREVQGTNPNVGLCLQSYLRRTASDLESLLPANPWIRLVKGAYNEPASVAFPKKRDVDARYVDLATTLIRHARSGGHPPVLGTHDMRLVDQLQREAARAGLDRGACEVHMLYGIGTSHQRRLAADGYTVRILISYGAAWFPWYMRRLAERPANVWFVVKSLVA